MAKMVSSGLNSLDDVLQSFRLGDNVVWQVDDLKDYSYFAGNFILRGIKDGRRCVYLRFAPHEPVLKPIKGLDIVDVDSAKGFDFFSSEVHTIIERYGKEVFYIFDNLSSLVVEWASDELLANFFKITCPYLYELDTIAFFALTRGRHSHSAVARIRNITSCYWMSTMWRGKHTYIH